jgi:hypothetical protein
MIGTHVAAFLAVFNELPNVAHEWLIAQGYALLHIAWWVGSAGAEARVLGVIRKIAMELVLIIDCAVFEVTMDSRVWINDLVLERTVVRYHNGLVQTFQGALVRSVAVVTISVCVCPRLEALVCVLIHGLVHIALAEILFSDFACDMLVVTMLQKFRVAVLCVTN